MTAVRIATVPGRNVIGIEVPNAKRETVFLSEILASEEVQKNPGRLSLALGKDISGTADRRRPGAHAASDDRGHHRVAASRSA